MTNWYRGSNIDEAERTLHNLFPPTTVQEWERSRRQEECKEENEDVDDRDI